MVRIVLDW